MENFNVYEDIEKRTGGDIYIGVVGPVRTGKSTFIKKFMEELVLNGISGEAKKRAVDELPQSASGKTVTTTEPKFVPGEAVKVRFSEKNGAEARIRLVDCVGYPVNGAFGFEEEGKERRINTPWSSEPMSFMKAAELGTEKVIREHSTIGVLITCDGSFTGIDRADYEEAEEHAVRELKEIGKPFVILLNSALERAATEPLRSELEKKYSSSVISVNCEKLTADAISEIIRETLFEFPLNRLDITLPDWLQVLGEDSKIICEISEKIRLTAQNVFKMRDCSKFDNCFSESEIIAPYCSCEMNLGDGSAVINLSAADGVFYKILSEECGEDLLSERKVMRYVKELSESKRNFDRVKDAFFKAENEGYGVVYPLSDEIRVEEVKPLKQGSSCGISLRAKAPGYHVVKVDVESEFSPVVGSGAQGESLVNGMVEKFGSGDDTLLDMNMFGKSLKELVEEGLKEKSEQMPVAVQRKMRRTLTRIVNEGKGGVICILL